MDLANIILSERSWIQKFIYYMIPLIGKIQNRQIHRNGKQVSGCYEPGGGRHENCVS